MGGSPCCCGSLKAVFCQLFSAFCALRQTCTTGVLDMEEMNDTGLGSNQTC